MRTVFIEPLKCIGCLQCEFACAVEHSVTRAAESAIREVPAPRKRIHVEPGPTPTTAFPNKCRHCDPAPCIRVCPTGAMTRVVDTDVVLVDAERCIGCAMCAVVCPFDVITFAPLAEGPHPDVSVAVKCDGCVDRLQRGEVPACVEACKVDALVYGDIDDLAQAGRLRITEAVLAANQDTSTGPRPDAALAGWRAWGSAELDAARQAQDGARARRLRAANGKDGHR